ncbi:MAG: hypothetical protein AB7T32_05860 [Dehalococcoidia bacterium]
MLGAWEKRFWIIIGIVAITGALVAVANAAIPGANGTIRGCYKTNTGDLRVVDESEACKNNETLLSWSQTGPQGPQGPQGEQGPQGPQGIPGPASNNSAAMATSAFQDLPIEAAVTLRAGTYFVIGVAEYYGDDSSSGFNSQCTFWRDAVGFDAGGTHIGGIGDSAIFSGKDDEHGQVTLITTTTLPADGSIIFYCAADNDAQAIGRIITIKVDGIN